MGIRLHGLPPNDSSVVQRPDEGVRETVGVYEGCTAVVEHQDKDQAAGLEMADSFILCSHQAFKPYIESIAVFIHKDDRMEVAQGRLANKEGEGDLTRLESGMSFLQVRASMSMKEKIRQVRSAI